MFNLTRLDTSPQIKVIPELACQNIVKKPCVQTVNEQMNKH